MNIFQRNKDRLFVAVCTGLILGSVGGLWHASKIVAHRIEAKVDRIDSLVNYKEVDQREHGVIMARLNKQDTSIAHLRDTVINIQGVLPVYQAAIVQIKGELLGMK